MIIIRRILLLSFLLLPFGVFPGDPSLPAVVREYPLIESLEEAKANPSGVYRLSLRKKSLRKIPAEIWEFTNLLELDLSHNRIGQIPDSVRRLKNLQVLNISYNKLQALPSELGELRELRQLLAYHNRLETLPAEVGRLEQLTHLDLWYNEIVSLPDSLMRLRQLEEIDLRGMIISELQKDKVREWFPNARVLTAPDCNCIK
jgi:Leucine-rich repeat (LRR) protein